MHLQHPLTISTQGRVALTDAKDHLDGMIEQILFTLPGERVNRPEFGCNLLSLVYEPQNSALVAQTQFMVQVAIQRWLEGMLEVRNVDIQIVDNNLLVRIDYHIRETNESESVTFRRGLNR